MSLGTIATLIFFILVFAILSVFLFFLLDPFDSIAKGSTVKSWLASRGELSSQLDLSPRPPVALLNKNPIILEEKDLKIPSGKTTSKANEQLAKEIYACANTFSFGAGDSLLSGKKAFCYPCAQIQIDKSIQGATLHGLKSHMETAKPSTTAPVFKEAINQFGENTFEETIPESLSLNNDFLYIAYLEYLKAFNPEDITGDKTKISFNTKKRVVLKSKEDLIPLCNGAEARL